MIYKTTAYIIQKIGGIPIVFTSQKDAADFLKVDQSALSHCAVDGTKCRGYTVTKALTTDVRKRSSGADMRKEKE